MSRGGWPFGYRNVTVCNELVPLVAFTKWGYGASGTMKRLLLLVVPLLLTACLTAQPPAATGSRSPGASVAQSTPAPWVFSLDREGLLLDGARVDVSDEEAFKRTLYAHWGHEPNMEVSPDVQCLMRLRAPLRAPWIEALLVGSRNGDRRATASPCGSCRCLRRNWRFRASQSVSLRVATSCLTPSFGGDFARDGEISNASTGPSLTRGFSTITRVPNQFC